MISILFSIISLSFQFLQTVISTKISAKFEGNILFVRQPKLITLEAKPVEETSPTVAAATVPTPQKPVDVPNVGQKTTNEKLTPTIQTNTGNNLRKDQEVLKMGLEESSKKHEDKFCTTNSSLQQK
ncbi:unnamed protein product [Lactuca saligna]|uniref:Uncharacterized protein n=1 Tax=Lactuca saligna TaxID=75948 RepID=A0AA36EHD3_LACSI|nr:unnamed protein product [Lactuca saligna]